MILLDSTSNWNEEFIIILNEKFTKRIKNVELNGDILRLLAHVSLKILAVA